MDEMPLRSTDAGKRLISNINRTTDDSILTFEVSGVHFCVDLAHLDRILFLPALQQVPGAPHYIAGTLSYAGQNIPVIDLALRVGLTVKGRYSVDTPMLLCQHQGLNIGLLVSQIYGVTERPRVNTYDTEIFEGSNLPYAGFMNLSDGEYLLLDILAFFTDRTVYRNFYVKEKYGDSSMARSGQ